MTNEERQRQKRLTEMRELAELYRDEDVSNAYPGVSEELTWAADEIERLAAKDTTLQALIGVLTYENKRAADEIERLAKRLKELEDEIELERELARYDNDTTAA